MLYHLKENFLKLFEPKDLILKIVGEYNKSENGTNYLFYGENVELDSTAVAVAVGLIILIILFGLLGNLMTIIAVKSNKKLQTTSNIFIVNLSICDIMDLCLVLPFNIYTYIVDGWFINAKLCKFIGILGYMLTGTTIMTITIIAYNRYKLVLDPGYYRHLYTKVNVAMMVFAAWSMPFACIVPAILEVWGKFCYVPMLVTCNLALDRDSQLFKLFLLVVRAVIPCTVIMYLYMMIFRTTNASHRRLHNGSRRTARSLINLHHQKELRLTKMMMMIFIIFIISYFPCTITSVIDWDKILSKNFHIFCAISVYIGSAANPLIYGLMNKQFRKEYKRILTCSKVSSEDIFSSVKTQCLYQSDNPKANRNCGVENLPAASNADTGKLCCENSKSTLCNTISNTSSVSTTVHDSITRF